MEYKVFLGKYRVPTTKSPRWWEARRRDLGVICQAEEIDSGRRQILEFIPLSFLSELERTELEQTAAAACRVEHPNLSRLYEFGVENDQFIFVVENLQGLTARSWVAAHGPVSPRIALGLVLQLLNTLVVVEQYGLSEPAINPANLMIVSGEETEGNLPLTKLLHFYVPRRLSFPFRLASLKSDDDASFASPEERINAPIDFRSQVYSLGALLWFLLGGTSPLQATRRAAPRESGAGIGGTPLFATLPESVRRLLVSMLARDPAERPMNAAILKNRVRASLFEIGSKKMTPLRIAQQERLQPLSKMTLLRAAASKLLATAGTAAIVAVGFLAITESKSNTHTANVSEQVSDWPSARNGSKPSGRLPEAMNFSVVPPSYEENVEQIQSVEHAAVSTKAQGDLGLNQPAPPAEGPAGPSIEVTTGNESKLSSQQPDAPPSVANAQTNSKAEHSPAPRE
jgi:serine/threonine protein kinase